MTLAVLQARLSLLRALASLWVLSEEQVQQYAVLNKPALQLSQAELCIGRALLPRAAAQGAQPGLAAAANSNKVIMTTTYYTFQHKC